MTLSTHGTQQPVVFGYVPQKRVYPRNDAVPMRLVSMLALAVSRTPGSACGFPLTVPCSGLRFVLWEGAAVPKLHREAFSFRGGHFEADFGAS